MFYKKKTGLPEESEIVMCTVTKVQYSSVFVTIDDYNISGMIHISEIAAGRIRNIRDYVKEGKKIVCKVLRVNQEKGHVDLSLRRVNDNQRRNKVNEIKFEQKAESIIEHVAKQNKMDVKKLYDSIANAVLDDYLYLHHAFEDIMSGNLDLTERGIDKNIAQQITELINQRFKPKAVNISGVLTITSYECNGIEIVKKSLEEAEKTEGVKAKYLGRGKYRIEVIAPDYKEAENKLKIASDMAILYAEKHNSSAEFSRGKE